MKIHLLRYPEDMKKYMHRIDLIYKIDYDNEARKEFKALAPEGTIIDGATQLWDDEGIVGPDDDLSFGPDSPGVWNFRALCFSPETQPVDVENIFSVGVIEAWDGAYSHSTFGIGFSIFSKIGARIEYDLKYNDNELRKFQPRLKKFVEAERDRLIQAWTNQ